jgi:hypothetical protein
MTRKISNSTNYQLSQASGGPGWVENTFICGAMTPEFTLVPQAAAWLFPRFKTWAGPHYGACCAVFNKA